MGNDSPVVVIGAGPQGLAAAAHLVERRLPVVVLEAGTGPASAVAEWGHVRLFSEWPELVDAAAARLRAPGRRPVDPAHAGAWRGAVAGRAGTRPWRGGRLGVVLIPDPARPDPFSIIPRVHTSP